MDTLIEKYLQYLKNLYEFLYEKYFFKSSKSIFEVNKFIPKDNFSFSNNYVILIATEILLSFLEKQYIILKKQTS